jgi:hypothetical protein
VFIEVRTGSGAIKIMRLLQLLYINISSLVDCKFNAFAKKQKCWKKYSDCLRDLPGYFSGELSDRLTLGLALFT